MLCLAPLAPAKPGIVSHDLLSGFWAGDLAVKVGAYLQVLTPVKLIQQG